MTPDDAAPGRAAAFFDLDRTLMAGSSAYQFVRAAYRAGVITRRQLAADAWINLRFRLQGSTDAGTDALRARMKRELEGVRQRDTLRLGRDVLAGILPRLNPEMLRVAYDHQDAGRPVYICTAASSEVAEPLAMVLGFDGAIATVPEVVDGLYTGDFDGPFTYREGKAEAMRRLAEREGIDLAASWAYSDSESDLPMLRLVGQPVAVNPDAVLARVAAEEGWEVVRFDRLGRRLKVGAATLVAAGLGATGAIARASRRDQSRGRRTLPRVRRTR